MYEPNKKINSKTETIVGFRARIKDKKTKMGRFADMLTENFGSTWFLVINIIVFIFWIVWNMGLIPGLVPFDPYPFTFLTMTVSLEAIFLSVIVLMSQNRSSKVADMREEVDFELNLRAEAEITRILNMLDEIHDHLGLSPEDDEELREMKQKTDIKEIKRAIESEDK